MRVTPVEFEWREWRLGEGRYKGKGPKSLPRPAHFPQMISPLWFARLAAFLAKRRTVKPLHPGLLAQPFAFYRNPRGGVENVKAARDHGLRVLLLNVRDFLPAEWATVRLKAEALGLTVGYWAHVQTLDELDRLLFLAHRDTRRIVCINVEAELATVLPPTVITDAVRRSGFQGEASLIVYGWVQNGVDLRPVGHLPILLEVFPQDDANLWPPNVKAAHCVEHARIQGARLPMVVVGTYPMSPRQAEKIRALGHTVWAGDAQPGWYDLTGHYGVYTVDDTGEDWEAWGWTP